MRNDDKTKIGEHEVMLAMIYEFLSDAGWVVWTNAGTAYHPTIGMLMRVDAIPYCAKVGNKFVQRNISIGAGPEKALDVIYEMMTNEKPKQQLLPLDGNWSNIKWDNINPNQTDVKLRARRA